MGTPFPVPPPHWGRPGRLHRCWHPNEKVNIEPKDLGAVGQLGVPRMEVPVWDQLGSPRADRRERAPQPQGTGQTGEQARRNCGVCSLHPQAGRGLSVCSVLRLRPLEPPPPAAPSPGSAWTLGSHTVSLRPLGPHRAPPLILPSHFQRLKCLFFGQGRK